MSTLKQQNMKENRIQKGFVMVVALIITSVVGIVTVSLVGFTLQEFRLSMRSSAYSRALHAAESGANLACEEFTRQIKSDSGAWSEWWTSGAAKTRSFDLTNALGEVVSSYSVSATQPESDICVITSTGLVSVAGDTIQRTIEVTIKRIKNTPFKYGVMSLGSLTAPGGVVCDSFDSTDPAKSTNGQYDPAKACANATMATLSTDNPAFWGTGGSWIKGDVAVPPDGEVRLTGSAAITGDVTYDAEQSISPVIVPFSLPATDSIDTAPWPSRFQSITVSGNQDMSFEKIKVVSNGELTITGAGTLRIYVDEDLTVSGSGSIRIVPSPSTADLNVEIYANGDVSLAGSGVVNDTLLAKNCSIWGTENCTDISVSGAASYIGTIYAPFAEISLTGSGAATGAFLGGVIKFTGGARYHIDESLVGESDSTGSGKVYKLTGWAEL